MIKFFKEIAALPTTLDPDAIYLVRVGEGFDLYASDSTGAFAHKLNSAGAISFTETDPVITYSGGVIQTITFSSGNHKAYTWVSGRISRVDYVIGAVIRRRDFTYNPDGSLASIADTII